MFPIPNPDVHGRSVPWRSADDEARVGALSRAIIAQADRGTWLALLPMVPDAHYAAVLAAFPGTLPELTPRFAAATPAQVDMVMTRIAQNGRGEFVVGRPGWVRSTPSRDKVVLCGLNTDGWYFYDVARQVYERTDLTVQMARRLALERDRPF